MVILELFGASTKWSQMSNSSFTDYIISENKQLKTELHTARKEAEKKTWRIKGRIVKTLSKK